MIEKMKFLSVTGPKEDIDRVVNDYLSKYEIHLENALSELKTVKSLRPYIEINPYKDKLTKVTKEGIVPDTSRTTNVREGSEILYPAKISYNRHSWRKYKLCAISGTLFRRRGEEHNDEKNDQRHDWSWIAGS